MQLHIDLIIPLSPTILPNGEYRKDVLLIFRFPFYGERAAYSATRKRRKNFGFSCRKMSENAWIRPGIQNLFSERVNAIFFGGEFHSIEFEILSFFEPKPEYPPRHGVIIRATKIITRRRSELKVKNSHINWLKRGKTPIGKLWSVVLYLLFGEAYASFVVQLLSELKRHQIKYWIIFQAQFHTILQAILPGSKMITKHPKRAPLMKLSA